MLHGQKCGCTYSVLARGVRLHRVHLVPVEQTAEESSSLRSLSRLGDIGAGVGTSSHFVIVQKFFCLLII